MSTLPFELIAVLDLFLLLWSRFVLSNDALLAGFIVA